MNNWEDLKNAVGQWSAANFGSQKGLGCLAPLLGIAEEAGEWVSAGTSEEEDDAIGDTCIFLVDYCYRAGVDLSGMPLEGIEADNLGLTAAVGRLCHVQLKRTQRIRGLEDWDAFEKARFEAIGGLIWELDYLIGPRTDDGTAFQIACRVWQSVVSKRKWHEVPDKPITWQSVMHDFSEVAGELNQITSVVFNGQKSL